MTPCLCGHDETDHDYWGGCEVCECQSFRALTPDDHRADDADRELDEERIDNEAGTL